MWCYKTIHEFFSFPEKFAEQFAGNKKFVIIGGVLPIFPNDLREEIISYISNHWISNQNSLKITYPPFSDDVSDDGFFMIRVDYCN